MAVNVTGLFVVSQAVARRMIPRGHANHQRGLGAVRAGAPEHRLVRSQQGCGQNLVEGMCTDWVKYGIQSNGIAPGYFAIEMTRGLVENPVFGAWVKRRTPAQRWGQVDELIGAVVFLASKASSFSMGTCSMSTAAWSLASEGDCLGR